MYLHEVAEEEASFTKDDMSKARFTVKIFSKPAYRMFLGGISAKEIGRW